MGIGNEEFMPDQYGGSTILLWPRRLRAPAQTWLFEHAKENGWVVMRSGLESEYTTANLLLREKGAASRYRHGYEKKGRSKGVPCFFDESEEKPKWTEIEESPDYLYYLASHQWMGPAAPQGLYCHTVAEVLSGGCEDRLRNCIKSTGGSYRAQ
jgi:hypothetical protein